MRRYDITTKDEKLHWYLRKIMASMTCKGLSWLGWHFEKPMLLPVVSGFREHNPEDFSRKCFNPRKAGSDDLFNLSYLPTILRHRMKTLAK